MKTGSGMIGKDTDHSKEWRMQIIFSNYNLFIVMRLETGSCLLLQNVSFAYNMVKQVCYYLHSLQSYVTLLKKVVVQFYPDFSNTTAGWFELKQGTPFPRQTMPEFYPRFFVSRFENSPLHYLRKSILINKCSFPSHIQNVGGSVQFPLLQKLPQTKKTQLSYPVSLIFYSL